MASQMVSMGMLLGEQMGDCGQGAEPSEAFFASRDVLNKDKYRRQSLS